MPVRYLNYTSRKRIRQQDVTIELQETDDGCPPTFSATLDLTELALPQDASLVITARRDRRAMRFEWGTVEQPAPASEDLRLTDVPINPTFRVMAHDASGKILAMADRIRPQRAAGSESLLWLKEEDLGQEVWRLDFGEPGDRPTLLVNSNIEGISADMRRDDALRGLVMPEVLRAILTRALIVDDAAPDDDEGEWADWLGFANNFYSAAYPTADASGQRSKSEISAWIDGAVDAFTRQRFHASERYAKARGR